MDMPEPDKKGLRNFGVITGLLFVALFGLLAPLYRRQALPVWPWVLAGALWLGALVAPAALKPAYRIWMRIGFVLGWINTRLIMGIVFFLVITPIGLIMRMFGKRTLALNCDTGQKSYRIKSKASSNKKMEVPF
jgi:hypothetical protein